jgi:thiol:disulfide interchange protein DsbC
MLLQRILIISLLCATLPIFADTFSKAKVQVEKNLRNVANGRFAEETITVIRSLPIKGLSDFYEVKVGDQNFIVSKDGQTAFLGDLYDLNTITNLSKKHRESQFVQIMRETVSSGYDDHMIYYPATAPKIGTVHIFTDTTCIHCKNLHNNMDKYLAAGIEIYYIPYPRSGMNHGNADYENAKLTMCAPDRKKAINALFNDISSFEMMTTIVTPACKRLIDHNIELASKVQIKGTPALYLSTGEILNGYLPPQALRNALLKP